MTLYAVMEIKSVMYDSKCLIFFFLFSPVDDMKNMLQAKKKYVQHHHGAAVAVATAG